MPFEDPHDAFAARVLLARAAERSLDVQYFIWHGDAVGTLLWEALWQAAERGVRVRLLVDDANNAGLDPMLAALDAHPNIELRLYNPFVNRGSRALGYLTDFSRLNRRMHNKSFTADNQVSVVGGRNIADEYFGAAEGLGFADLDVMAIGPVVQEVSREFDLYWNSPSAYPAAPFVGPPPADPAAVLQPRFEAVPQDPRAALYLRGGAAGAVRPGVARAPAGVRLGHRPGAVRRPRQDARRQRGQRPAAAAGADAAHGLAAEAAGHHLAVLRARRRGHRHAGARWPGAACRCAC